nr:hypothetical protein [uncultured Oscillibacter sp.]
MKKRKIAVPAALVLAAVLLWGGGRRGPVTVALNGEEAPVTLTEDEHVYLTVDPVTVTATGAVATLHKEGIPQIGYGDRYYIARRAHHSGREWTEVPWLDSEGPSWWMSLTIMGLDPDGEPDLAHRESDLPMDWTDIYGPLEPGKYLLVKEVVDPDDRSNGRYIGAAFTVK